jgi:hypothetical protein
MAQSLANTFRDTTAIAARTAEETNPDASWVNGMNNSACMPGIGVAFGQPDLWQDPDYLPAIGDPSSWTLLDQDGDIRVPQVSQLIGGGGFVPRTGNVPTTWDETQALYSDSGAASSGGVEGDGKAEAEFIIAAGNPTQDAKDGDPDLDGTITVLGTANLQTLAVGWTHTPV